MSNGSSAALLSIVIATRNRIPYAISAINSILEIDDERLELVIQDNSDSNELNVYVSESINDSRLIYQWIRQPLSMVDNFNAALELANGEYVCVIGDDDGVNPEIIDAADWAKRNNLDSLGIRQTSFYLWPGTGLNSTLFSKVEGGHLSIEPFSGRVQLVDVEKEVKALLRNGGLYYLNFSLPKAYHGLARRKCFDIIKERTGNYFGGTSPDIFASIAIACVSDRVAFIEYPLTIPGHCSVAANTHHVEKAHLRPFSEAPHFKNRGGYEWCDLVPKVFVGEAFWVDSAIHALRAMGRDDLVTYLNTPKLAAHIIGSYRGLSGTVLETMSLSYKKDNKSIFIAYMKFSFGLLSGPGKKLIKRIWNRLLILLGIRVLHQFYGVKDMSQCSKKLTSFLQDNKYSLSLDKHSELNKSKTNLTSK